jgi:hypothetical protein
MTSHADVEKLRGMRAPGPAVLSLYLPVPLDPAGVRGLAALPGHRRSVTRGDGR